VKRALRAYLDRLWNDEDHAAAVLAAAEACAGEPWKVVGQAGLLARCRVERADRLLGLNASLQVRPAEALGVEAKVPEGAPYPVLLHPGRRQRGAYDTPVDMARRVVSAAAAACEGPLHRGLDPACGTGAFLVAMAEQNVPEVHGSDLDPLVLEVARIAVPRAQLSIADALHHGPPADLVVGNPPFVPPERQDKELRISLRRRFPWLRGRFDLVVPFAAVAAERCRYLGGIGLVLPAPALVQPYGAVLRRRWLQRHLVTDLTGPYPFPGASVEVMLLVMRSGDGPAPMPPFGMVPEELLRLENVPFNPELRPGDVELVDEIRECSLRLGELCLVDTGVVAHGPGRSREALLHTGPGPDRVPYADAKEFFQGRHRWLEYRPERMHRAKRPEMFEHPKIVVQRIRGKSAVKAAIDREGIYVGHTCTVVCPRRPERVPLDRLRHLILSPLVDAVTRIERGQRVDLYPRDVAAFPVPRSWLEDSGVPLEDAWGLEDEQVERLMRLVA
jgi:SAM-dependent methyltransferase